MSIHDTKRWFSKSHRTVALTVSVTALDAGSPCFVNVGIVCVAILLGLATPAIQAQIAAEAPDTVSVKRVYSHLMDPREHPDYERRAVKPPSWVTFKNRTQFTCLRGFNVTGDLIVDYKAEIEKFTRTHRLGDVIWPAYPILFAKNIGELALEIKNRDLYLFDIWGYVPGSGPGGYWQQFKVPEAALTVLESTLGERWLGTDIGEQDGRYIGGYANQMTPSSAGRFEQYLNFQRHFERMGNDLGHKHSTLVSLNYGHYFLKEGTYTLIGAETAQALPNNQVYYAFIRGAGKQYGVPWFGNASIYNRWGFKTYGPPGRDSGYEYGPTKGTSLSLMKRLIYSHILGNCVAVGFENGWFDGEKLSPLGRIQQAAQEWVKANGQPGAMHTPVALLLDFYAGWTFPRHLYSDNVYRVWGNLPYEEGDYLTDAILDMLYPGYEKSSYYHDESGFITPTPYGDIADCLLSDAPGWMLARYPVLIVAGALEGGLEVRDKLDAYVRDGGHLVITADNLAKLPGGIGGHTNSASLNGIAYGKGRLTLFESPLGVVRTDEKAFHGKIDQPLAKSYALDPNVRRGLDDVFREQRLFEVQGDGLSLITCRKVAGEFTLGVANNTWQEQPFKIVSHCGAVESIRRHSLDESEKGAIGYLPESVDGKAVGHTTDSTIAGGDIVLFSVRVKESGVEEVPHISPSKPAHGRFLPLRQVRSVKEEILARPGFFEHYDGVVVPGSYLSDHEKTTLQAEAPWLRRQGLHICVDLSTEVDLYPSLRLIDNAEPDYSQTMALIRNVMEKMELLGAHDLILSLHRHPENNFTGEQTEASFVKTLKALAVDANSHRVIFHLRMATGKPPWNLKEAAGLLDRIGATNLRLAPSTALLAEADKTESVKKWIQEKTGIWLVAGSQVDEIGRLWNTHAPLNRQSDVKAAKEWIALAPEAPIVFDAVYKSRDEEYKDVAGF